MKTYSVIFVGFLTAFGASNGTARADHWNHMEELAHTLEQQSAEAAREIYRHFRHTPQFTHLYRDIYEMYQLAAHLEDVAHRRSGLTHLQHDVEELDELFHHVEELVAAMARSRRHDDHHGIEFGGGRFEFHFGRHGHSYHGDYHMRRLRGLLAAMEDTLHHLQDDLRDLNGTVGGVPVPPPALDVPPPTGRLNRPTRALPRSSSRNRGVSFSLILK